MMRKITAALLHAVALACSSCNTLSYAVEPQSFAALDQFTLVTTSDTEPTSFAALSVFEAPTKTKAVPASFAAFDRLCRGCKCGPECDCTDCGCGCSEKKAQRESDRKPEPTAPTQKQTNRDTNVSSPRYVAYPESNAGWWSRSGTKPSKAEIVDHLLSAPDHRGKYDRAYLMAQSYAALETLHAHDHEHRVDWHRVKLTSKQPAVRESPVRMVRETRQVCRNGYCTWETVWVPYQAN